MRSLLVHLAFSAACLLLAGGVFAAEPQSLVYTDAPLFVAGAAGAGGERFPGGASLHLLAGGRNTLLVPGFAASADPALSFDGRRVLFSGRQRPADRWQIWEAPLAGGAPRRVIVTAEDAITPFYLPGDRVVFALRTRRGFQLQTVPLAGGAAVPLTFTSGNYIVSDVLRDGRVLFEGAHPSGFRDLYTVFTDGSGVETYRCDHGRDRHAGRQLESGDIVFDSNGHLARFTSSRATEVPLAPTAGEFAGPIAELAESEWLVTWRPSAGSPFSLYRWSPGQRQPRDALARNAWQPVVVRPRPRPRIHPSGLGEREGANTLCLSVYTSKLQIAAGSVAAVRVWVQDDEGRAVAMGTAPVETDGSFFVTTPAERPLRFELLDRAGRAVAAEKGWFWYRRGEQRICVGCHAGPERAPDNALPAVLVHQTEPVKLTQPSHTNGGGSR